jgi:hypothetical protein
MTVQREELRSPSWSAIAMLVSMVVLGVAAVATVYRLSAGGLRSKATARSAPVAEPLRATTRPVPPVPRTAPATAQTAERVETRQAVPPSRPEIQNAGLSQPFVEARQERRDSVWALQMESTVRDALGALRDKKVTLTSVQCASVRCTLEGTVGPGGSLEQVASAASKVGLTQGRFKHSREPDGTMSFSAVIARQGYKIDGSPKEGTKAL